VRQPIRVTVWNEHRQERDEPAVAAVYLRGIHAVLGEALAEHAPVRGFAVRTATLDELHQGLPPARLAATDVLVWWGHRAHHEVSDELTELVAERVRRDRMGLVALHSAHFSKPFLRLMGTACTLVHADRGEREEIRVTAPDHPIAAGLGEGFTVERAEMYGEPFDIPEPSAVVFESRFAGGERFRSGCCFELGAGRVFYFRPGHESYPIYHQPPVRRALANAVAWAAAER
jgi:trehalose utilization protein